MFAFLFIVIFLIYVSVIVVWNSAPFWILWLASKYEKKQNTEPQKDEPQKDDKKDDNDDEINPSLLNLI